MPVDFAFAEAFAQDKNAYPITVKLRHLTEEEATPKQNVTSTSGQAAQDGIFRSNLAEDDTMELIRIGEVLQSKPCREEVVKAKYMLGADGAHSRN
jgi:phenol 2-monooxygenase